MVKNVALASYWSRMSRIWPVESGQGPSSNVSAITLSSPTLALYILYSSLTTGCVSSTSVMPDTSPVFVVRTPFTPGM